MIPVLRFAVAAGLLVGASACPTAAQTWSFQPSPTNASLRGISVVDERVAWASGTGGTCLKTSDGGISWSSVSVPGASELDFRGISANSASSAWLLSSGEGDKSRIYRTIDGGLTWRSLFTNPDAKGFFDAIAFWDSTHGVVLGDPVDGRFVILTTSDAGATWKREQGPAALAGEGVFAASNTSLILVGTNDIWFASGGVGAARVFHSSDRGQSWSMATTPLRNDSAGAGIFSLAATPGGSLIAVGGDYARPGDALGNIAVSSGQGGAWRAPTFGPRGYRSAIVWLPHAKVLITAGPSGSEWSRDRGETWIPVSDDALNAIGVGGGDACWAVGPKGRIAKFNAAKAK